MKSQVKKKTHSRYKGGKVLLEVNSITIAFLVIFMGPGHYCWPQYQQ